MRSLVFNPRKLETIAVLTEKTEMGKWESIAAVQLLQNADLEKSSNVRES